MSAKIGPWDSAEADRAKVLGRSHSNDRKGSLMLPGGYREGQCIRWVSGPSADRVQWAGPPPGTPIDHRPCKGSAVFFLLLTARPPGSMLAAGTGVQQTGILAVMGSRDDSGG